MVYYVSAPCSRGITLVEILAWLRCQPDAGGIAGCCSYAELIFGIIACSQEKAPIERDNPGAGGKE